MRQSEAQRPLQSEGSHACVFPVLAPASGNPHEIVGHPVGGGKECRELDVDSSKNCEPRSRGWAESSRRRRHPVECGCVWHALSDFV